MKQPFFLIGPFLFYLYGFFIGLGGFLGYIIALRRLAKFSLKQADLNELLIFLIPSCIIGARIYHVLSWISYYQIFPKEIFSLRQGGLGIFGALIGGLLTIFIFSKIKRIKILNISDLLAPSILVAQGIGRIGNFFNQEAFGPPTSLPWKIYVPLEKRPINFLSFSYFHPTFFYESILCFLAFFILIYLEKKLRPEMGFSSGFYLLSYGVIRFFTEFLRFDTWAIFGIKVAQVLSLIFFIIGAYFVRIGISRKN